MIIRKEHKNNFTMISNSVIRDNRLSSDGLKLLLFMLSCSDDWNFCVKGLASALGWSDRKIMRIVPELKKAGYLIQRPQFDQKGRFLPAVWEVYEEPQTAIPKSCIVDSPQYQKTAMRSDRNTDEPQCGKMVVIRRNNIKEGTNIKKEQHCKKGHTQKLGIFQNVFLTESEQKELCDQYGFETVIDYIDRLSAYQNQNPNKKYKSHKDTIEKWIIEDKEKAI